MNIFNFKNLILAGLVISTHKVQLYASALEEMIQNTNVHHLVGEALLEDLRENLGEFTPLVPEHTAFGEGVRCPEIYGDNPVRDALKKGEEITDYEKKAKANYIVAKVVLDNAWAAGKDPKNSWADPENIFDIPQQLQAGRVRPDVKRFPYSEKDGIPQNPLGKTGFTGRGELGLWGPNPAADPVVFRVNQGQLQVLLVERSDAEGEFAIPGGMVDPADSTVSVAALRELREETGLEAVKEKMLFLGDVYSGHADDPRDTDNAWMVTTVYAWLLTADIEEGKIESSDEVISKKWQNVMPILSGKLKLWEGHEDFVRGAVHTLLQYDVK